MKANGTSLGADNGIGLSMALAILADDSLPHPPLEVLTTTNEEDGMSGASHLSPTFIRGRKVINLDSEAYDETTVASAGAIIQEAHLPISRVAMPKDYITYNISVSGGKGGHSGVDINKGRANAIKVLANLLLVAIRQCDIKLYIVSFQGGQAAASIPSQAEAKVVIPKDNSSDFLSLVAQCNYALIKQFGETDPDIIIHAEPSVWHSSVMSEETTQVLLASINAVPVGVLQMSPDDITPLTSNNIGLVNITGTGTGRTLNLTFHTRSFIDSEMRRIASEIEKIYHLSGATVTKVMESPAWTESDTTLLQLTNSVFRDVLGFEPRAVSMHFVLEAGYLVNIFPGLHIVSIGPRILEPHSIHERVDLNTCDDIWRVTLELLKRL
jgi:dipeptidase D